MAEATDVQRRTSVFIVGGGPVGLAMGLLLGKGGLWGQTIRFAPPMCITSADADFIIEVFDAAMLYNARNMVDLGLLKRPCQVQFVMGIPNALPARRNLLEFLIGELKELMPDATWSAAGIGRHQLEVNQWCLELGGHVRTGLEDNIKFDKNRLARSNGELVARLAAMCTNFGRHAANATEARKILQLPTG